MLRRRRPDEIVQVDVLDVSDFRFEGGTSGSVAEEVVAQAAAGYTSGLLHFDGPLVAKTSPVNQAVRRCVDRGLAELVLPHQLVHAKVVVVRHPAVLEHADVQLTGVTTDHVVVVANAAPRDIDGFKHYRVDAVREAALRHFGVAPRWAPIGPLVRDAIAEDITDQLGFEDDWVNIIDVDAWAAARAGWQADRPVIGRHSRDNPQKWPSDAATLQQVYPTDGSMSVRVLGGAGPAAELLGGLPESWQVLPFGAMSPREFLAGLDFFVYYHNPRWVEAFGRTILEALASGAVTILPPHFAALFGDGAVYAEADQVRSVINRLYGDRPAYVSQAARGQQAARERFGHEAHAARIAALIGPPAGSSAPTDAVPTPPVAIPTVPEVTPAAMQATPNAAQAAPNAAQATPNAAEVTPTAPTAARTRIDHGRIGLSSPSIAGSAHDQDKILMVSSNGAGMGHLTRLLAYAERARPDVRPHFLSLSQAVPIVGRLGHPFEYVPSMTVTGLEPSRWQAYFRRRVSETIERLRPAAVVFDGTVPYEEIPGVRDDHPHVPWVWSRRGMWYRGQNRDQLAKADWFDLVVEPGDFAAPADRGVTAEAPATKVGPVTLLDRDDLDDRATARAALGLDPNAPTVLVTLGAGNINDATSATRVVLGALASLGLRICVTKPEIAERAGVADEDVHVVGEYPLSRRYAAFDVAVSAAGYNSFHELLRFGVPTLFLPNLETALDDQHARARYVAEAGWAHSLDRPEPHTVGKLVEDLLENGPAMVDGAVASDPGNGAGPAMAALEELTVAVR